MTEEGRQNEEEQREKNNVRAVMEEKKKWVKPRRKDRERKTK